MSHGRSKSDPTPEFKLDDKEIELRKKWLELNPADEDLLRNEIDRVISHRVDQLMESMYGHFLAFEETKSFFHDESTLQRAQSAQKQYFERLTKGDYGPMYVQERMGVGSTHQRIELDPKWYIGAYNRACSWIIPLLTEEFRNEPDKLPKVILALLKIIFFDMGLALDSYINTKEEAIKRHRDAIRELETEKRVTKSILEGAPIGIVSLNETLQILECNEEFVSIVGGVDRQQVIGRSLPDITPNLKTSDFSEVIATGQPCRRSQDKLMLLPSTVDETYWDWAAWPVKEGANVTGLVAMFANTTDRVLLQQQREDFVATLTHDLKTPVSATNRAVRFLLEGDFGTISEPQRELLETILQSNTALYSLVQTLLDVYKFDSGVKEFHMRNCNLAVTIAQMVTEIMPLAQGVGVELRAVLPSDPQDIKCDEEDIRRLLQNLLDNSLKYTPSGGSVLITMTQGEGKTRVTVADTGRGVPEENMPKLFQRFWQAGSTGRYYASTGLGLYLCRRIAEGHGGRIWCTSAPGAGSTFTFEV